MCVAGQIYPHCHGAEQHRGNLRYISPTHQVLQRATEAQQENFTGLLLAAGQIRGGSVTTGLSYLLFLHKDKSVSVRPARGALVSITLRILRSLVWEAAFRAGPPGFLLMSIESRRAAIFLWFLCSMVLAMLLTEKH